MKDTTTTQASAQKVLRGVAVSDAMDKTVVVRVESFKTDKKYNKKYKSSKKYKVHDENNAYTVGETVEFVQSRPISKDKSFTVVAK